MTQELMNNIRQEARNRAIEQAKFIQKRYTANFYSSIFIAYTRSLELFDMCEEAGLIRHNVKRQWVRYEAEYLSRAYSLKAGAMPSFLVMLNDFGTKINELVDSDFKMLHYACKNVLDKKHKENSNILGFAEAVSILWLIAVMNIERVFNEEKKKTGFDLQKIDAFYYTDISDTKKAYDRFVDALSREKEHIHFDRDNRVVACVENMARKIYDDKIISEADRTAYQFNREYLAESFGEELIKKSDEIVNKQNKPKDNESKI